MPHVLQETDLYPLVLIDDWAALADELRRVKFLLDSGV
jgi:hypothetical protein